MSILLVLIRTKLLSKNGGRRPLGPCEKQKVFMKHLLYFNFQPIAITPRRSSLLPAGLIKKNPINHVQSDVINSHREHNVGITINISQRSTQTIV